MEYNGRAYHARIYHAEVGHFGDAAASRLPPHSHPVYHIVLVTAGQGHFLYEGALIPVGRGCLILVGPGVPHGFDRILGESTSYAEVTFDFVDQCNQPLMLPFEEMLRLWSGHPGGYTFPQRISEAGIALVERALEALVTIRFDQGKEQFDFRLAMGLQAVLAEVHVQALRANPAVNLWERAHQFLLDNYTQPILLSELASKLRVHPDHLTRQFQRIYGQTPMNFLNTLRVESAKVWLLGTDYPLKEIADRVGYSDPGYFARVFRKKVKVSPGRFREQARTKL